MPWPQPSMPGRLSRDLPFHVFLVTVLLCLLRSRELPSAGVELGGTSLDIGPADVGLAVTALLALARLRAERRVPSPWLVGAALALAGLVFLSSLPNGSYAISAAAKLGELFALTLGAVAFLQERRHLALLLGALVLFVGVAAAWGLVEFVTAGGGRQDSFMGEHDMAALGTMTVAAGLAHLYVRPGRIPPLAALGIVAGAVGITVGASLASLIGLYLAGLALVGIALARGRLRLPAVGATVLVAALVTAGTWAIRGGEFSFLQAWFGPPPEEPGQYAASWSQRLIYAYVGGRIFLASPLFGTGWHGALPPEEFARFLPDARARFSDQPAHYFPQPDSLFTPQQTYDQVLFQLGAVGGILLLVVGGLAIMQALRGGLRWPRLASYEDQAFVPLAWVGSLIGVLAGAALFGGTPIGGIFWLTLGVAAVAPVLARSEARR